MISFCRILTIPRLARFCDSRIKPRSVGLRRDSAARTRDPTGWPLGRPEFRHEFREIFFYLFYIFRSLAGLERNSGPSQRMGSEWRHTRSASSRSASGPCPTRRITLTIGSTRARGSDRTTGVSKGGIRECRHASGLSGLSPQYRSRHQVPAAATSV